MGENPEPVKYYDCSSENRQLREQLKEANAFKDMFLSAQLELRKAKEECERLTTLLYETESQLNHARNVTNHSNRPARQQSKPRQKNNNRQNGPSNRQTQQNTQQYNYQEPQMQQQSDWGVKYSLAKKDPIEYIQPQWNEQQQKQAVEASNQQFIPERSPSIRKQTEQPVATPIKSTGKGMRVFNVKQITVLSDKTINTPAPQTKQDCNEVEQVDQDIQETPIKSVEEPLVQQCHFSTNQQSVKCVQLKAGDGRDKRPEGEKRLFYYNGEFHGSLPYDGLVCNGESKTWYPNGQLRQQMFFVNGVLEGQCKKWYENGKIMRFCLYKNGQMIGRPIDYGLDGQGSNKKPIKPTPPVMATVAAV